VNPHWEADFKQLPTHPIARGVKAFAITDEWYYHMRFVAGMKGVTPILTALPDAETLSRPDGAHSGNPDVRKAVAAGESQHVAWAYESPEGKRGFGFTGGHFHKNWANEDVRKVVLNSILWVAQVEVPADGVKSVLTPADLQANLDEKGGKPRVKPPAAAPPAGK
jgi:type 1 glutamine amidotransferase